MVTGVCCRNHFLVGWTVRGGSVCSPQRHQQRRGTQAVGAELQLRARPAGLRARRVAGQEGERGQGAGGAHQEGQGTHHLPV